MLSEYYKVTVSRKWGRKRLEEGNKVLPVKGFCCNEGMRKYEDIFVVFSSLHCVK